MGRRGFSLLELLLVVAIIVIVGAMATLNVETTLKNSRVSTAYDLTLSELRKARQGAIDERCVYLVSFTAPRTIRTQRIRAGVTTEVNLVNMPTDIQFRAEPGIPNINSKTPDHFGTGRFAIDFSVDFGGAGTQIYFQPDGTAFDSLGRINNGVVYLVRPGEVRTAHAISVFGSTGRIRGWRIVVDSGGTTRWQ